MKNKKSSTPIIDNHWGGALRKMDPLTVAVLTAGLAVLVGTIISWLIIFITLLRLTP